MNISTYIYIHTYIHTYTHTHTTVERRTTTTMCYKRKLRIHIHTYINTYIHIQQLNEERRQLRATKENLEMAVKNHGDSETAEYTKRLFEAVMEVICLCVCV